MYLLPHDGSPRLLDDTAILRDRLSADLKATNPKSVTVFLDTCYSGVTRNEEMLIAGRPIVLKAKEQPIPYLALHFSLPHIMSRYQDH